MAETLRTLETLELVGGTPCLDFVNTINSRLHPEHDYLVEYVDLLGWAKKVGILSSAQASALQKQAKQNAKGARNALKAAWRLRELLYRLFASVAKGAQPAKQDLDSFVTSYAEAIARGQLVDAGEHYRTNWRMEGALDSILWPLIYSAGELLQSKDLNHVKECPGCGWLFLDTSKNQSRRWCSMNTCGARDKMRRYHRRQREK